MASLELTVLKVTAVLRARACQVRETAFAQSSHSNSGQMESFQLELHPETGPIHIALFKGVTNAAELRQRLVSQDHSLYICLSQCYSVSTFQVLLAINKAVHKEVAGKMKTRNINSEIVYDFSSSNNISQSLKRYGVADDSKALIVIAIGGDPAKVEKQMKADVHGELVPLSTIPEFSDIKAIKKFYQLNDKHLSEDIDTLMPLIAGAMSLKEIK